MKIYLLEKVIRSVWNYEYQVINAYTTKEKAEQKLTILKNIYYKLPREQRKYTAPKEYEIQEIDLI